MNIENYLSYNNNKKYISKKINEIKSNKIILPFEKKYPHFLQYLSNDIKDKLINDKLFIIHSIRNTNFEILNYLDDKFKDDEDIAIEAIKKDNSNFKNISKRLKNNKEFILKILKENKYCFFYIDDKFKDDKDIVLEAVKNDYDVNNNIYNYNYIIVINYYNKFKKDKDILKEAIKNYYYKKNALLSDIDLRELKILKQRLKQIEYEEELNSKINKEVKKVFKI